MIARGCEEGKGKECRDEECRPRDSHSPSPLEWV